MTGEFRNFSPEIQFNAYFPEDSIPSSMDSGCSLAPNLPVCAEAGGLAPGYLAPGGEEAGFGGALRDGAGCRGVKRENGERMGEKAEKGRKTTRGMPPKIIGAGLPRAIPGQGRTRPSLLWGR